MRSAPNCGYRVITQHLCRKYVPRRVSDRSGLILGMNVYSQLSLRSALVIAVLVQARQTEAAEEYMLDTIRPPSSVRAIALDPDGFLWLGGLRTLSRFDGVNNTQEIEGLPFEQGPWVVGLATTGKGEFYAAIGDAVERLPSQGQAEGETFHAPGPLYRRTKGQWMPVLPKDPGRRFAVSGMVATETALWIVNEDGLTRIQGGAMDTFSPKTKLGTDELIVVANRTGDTVWIGTRTTLAQFDGREFRAIPLPRLSGSIVAITPGSDDTVWVADSASIYQVNGIGQQLQQFATRGLLTTEPSLHKVRLLSARDGTLWIGTTQGLFHAEKSGRLLSRYGLGNGLSDERILSLWEDPSGGIWAGTQRGGVLRLRPRRVHVGEGNNAWPTVTTVTTVGPDGTSWVAGAGGVHWRGETGDFVAVSNADAIPAAPVASMAPAGPDSVWIATMGQGLQHVSRTARTTVNVSGIGRNAKVTLVWNGGARGLWLGLADGTVLRFADSIALLGASPVAAETHSPAQRLCAGVPRNAAAARDGGVWIAMEGGGLARINDGKASCPYPDTFHKLGSISSVYEDGDGTLFVGRTKDAGLLVKRGTRWSSYTVREGLHCDTIHEIIDNGRGHIWLACAGGLQRVSKAALLAQADGQTPMVPAIAITEADGLPKAGTSAQAHPVAAMGKDGGLWVAATHGAALVTDRPADSQLANRVIVTGMLVNGKPVDTEKMVVIHGRNANVEFRYAIPTLETPDRSVFGFFLQGHDRGWERGNPLSNQILYSDLGPGHYQMRWLASDGNGNWLKDETRLDFLIELPLTERGGFWIGLSLLVVIVVVLSYAMRLRKIRARFQLIHRERVRIARDLHDLIGQSFSSVGFHLDAARRVARTEGSDPSALLDTARQTISQAKKDLRRAIWDLRTERIDVPPLPDALNEVVQAHSRRLRGNTIRISLTTAGRDLPRSALHEFEMVQIVDEAIWNCIKHSNATQVRILLSVGDTNITMQIIDDGTGIIDNDASKEKPGHFGIVGMHERAQRIGGTMVIKPIEPSGTEVRIDVPLSEWVGENK
jgi:signal transduction histidine kinase/ligand-binding sensor domain-containing protein